MLKWRRPFFYVHEADPKHGGKPWAELVAECPETLHASGRFGMLPSDYVTDGKCDVLKWAADGHFKSVDGAPTVTVELAKAQLRLDDAEPIVYHRLADFELVSLKQIARQTLIHNCEGGSAALGNLIIPGELMGQRLTGQPVVLYASKFNPGARSLAVELQAAYSEISYTDDEELVNSVIGDIPLPSLWSSSSFAKAVSQRRRRSKQAVSNRRQSARLHPTPLAQGSGRFACAVHRAKPRAISPQRAARLHPTPLAQGSGRFARAVHRAARLHPTPLACKLPPSLHEPAPPPAIEPAPPLALDLASPLVVEVSGDKAVTEYQWQKASRPNRLGEVPPAACLVPPLGDRKAEEPATNMAMRPASLASAASKGPAKGATAKSKSKASNVLRRLRVRSSDEDTPPTTKQPTHFLLYLNSHTFVGMEGMELAREVYCATVAKLPIVMVHECMDLSRGGCPFERFFEATPPELIEAGLYTKLSFTCYPGELDRRVSLAIIARHGLGFKPTKNRLKELWMEMSTSSVDEPSYSVEKSTSSVDETSCSKRVSRRRVLRLSVRKSRHTDDAFSEV